MPVSVRVEAAERLAYVHSRGVVTLAETVEAIVAVAGSPDFEADFGVLVDLRQMDTAPGVGEVIEVASALETVKRLARGRVAVVAARTAHFRLAQIVSALASAAGLEQRAFRDIDGARDWLDGAD